MSHRHRILLVDDDPEYALVIREALRHSGSYSLDVAGTLAEMWALLQGGAYDLILLDYVLPDGNGLTALGELPTRGVHTPVIMATGRGDETIAVQAMRSGAADYVVKGGNFFLTLPPLIDKAIRHHELLITAQRTLDRVRYQALLLDNVRDAVVVWDMEGRITYWNPAAESLFGWEEGERAGRDARSAYLAHFVPAVSLSADTSLDGVEVERQFTTKDGRTIWIGSCLSTLKEESAAGRQLGYIDVCRDITPRKEMEAQIRAARLHITQAARLAAIGELASGVAHQVNNPLTTIIAEAQILLRELQAEGPAQASARAIEQAGWRAQQVVQQLMEFSRPASGSLALVSINRTIERSLSLVGAQIRAAGVHVHTNLAGELPPVHGSSNRLEDLWMNLMLLARDAAVQGTDREIWIRSSLHGETITVELSHNGAPIPPERMRTLFEPDFLSPSGSLSGGIELTICREIVRQHRGEIGVSSEPRQGTVFTVTFPTGGVDL